MSSLREVTYSLEFRVGKKRRRKCLSLEGQQKDRERDSLPIPRIARLVALAIRFEGLLRDRTLRDYAELARLGRVTRARMTQIMKLLHLAPDIQEQLLFLPPLKGLNERNLRPTIARIDWAEQRHIFEQLKIRLQKTAT